MYRKEREIEGQLEHTDISTGYIQALGLQNSKPDLGFLNEISRRHTAQFAFSSVGPMLGEDLPLDIESLFQRIVTNRRGGYCFEQNGLLYAMLKDLGFNVKLYLARVIYNEDIHPPLTHRITMVEFGTAQYVIDVGFGPLGPQLPVCMSGEVSQQNFREFRIEERHPGVFHMQTLKDGAYYSLYKFELARYGTPDCEVGHFYSHKHPSATFVNHLVVSRIMDDEILSLRNREFWKITGTGERREVIKDSRQLHEALTDQLGVEVNQNESHLLFERTS